MISLDHICIWSRNLYRTTIELSELTGLGSRDGGYFDRYGLGQKVIPISDDVYIEVESIVEHDQIRRGDATVELLERETVNGDCFMGWCLRSDSLDEMKRFAGHRGTPLLDEIPGGKRAMDGNSSKVVHAPAAMESWPLGRPNLYYVPDMYTHPCRVPCPPGTALPRGVRSLEIGGTEADLVEWMGDLVDPRAFPFEIVYNGGSHGLYAVTIDTTAGPRIVRLNPVAL